jgi:hypothetical protein
MSGSDVGRCGGGGAYFMGRGSCTLQASGVGGSGVDILEAPKSTGDELESGSFFTDSRDDSARID